VEFSVDPLRQVALRAMATGPVDSGKAFEIAADTSPKIRVPLRPVRPKLFSQTTRLPVLQRNGTIHRHPASPADPFLINLQLEVLGPQFDNNPRMLSALKRQLGLGPKDLPKNANFRQVISAWKAKTKIKKPASEQDVAPS
jgi:hypothetical protein